MTYQPAEIVPDADKVQYHYATTVQRTGRFGQGG